MEMKSVRKWTLKLLGLILGLSLLGTTVATKASPNAPQTQTQDNYRVYHGELVLDPYDWLEDDHSDEVAQWLKQQSHYTEQILEQNSTRQSWAERVQKIIETEHASVITLAHGYLWEVVKPGKKQPVLAYSRTLEETPETIFDPISLNSEGTTSISNIVPSWDGRFAVLAISEAGSDQQTLRVLEIKTGKLLNDTIPNCKFTSIAWRPDNKSFTYTWWSKAFSKEAVTTTTDMGKQVVRLHRLGESLEDDLLIYDDRDFPDKGFELFNAGDRYLVVSVWDGTDPRREVLLKHYGQKEWLRITEGYTHRYDYIGMEGNSLYFISDRDGPTYGVVAYDCEQGQLRTVVAPEKRTLVDVRLQGYSLGLIYSQDGSDQLEVINLASDSQDRHLLAKELNCSSLSFNQNYNNEDSTLLVSTSSLLLPNSIAALELQEGTLDYQEVYRPHYAFDFSGYETKKVFVSSKDGTKVPLYVTMKRGVSLDGSNPCILYGYGGFNISIKPTFRATVLPWLESGGIWAQACLRGGGEYGEQWHQAGMLKNKQNVFDDFISSAEFLVEQGYTSSDNLAIYGGSNGGLLVAACEVQRPDLFGVVLCRVPVIDMLKYHLFTIGRYWIPEWGSSDDPEMYPVLKGYSPYHNGTRADYPATLIMTADHDDRVVPGHAFKYAARLQSLQSGSKPIALRVQYNAGHGRGQSSDQIAALYGDIYSFCESFLGTGKSHE